MVDDGWSFDKHLSVGNIIASILLMLTFTGFYMTQDRRITRLEEQTHAVTSDIVRMLEDQMERDTQQDLIIQQFRSEMRTDARDIQNKLDRLVESFIE